MLEALAGRDHLEIRAITGVFREADEWIVRDLDEGCTILEWREDPQPIHRRILRSVLNLQRKYDIELRSPGGGEAVRLSGVRRTLGQPTLSCPGPDELGPLTIRDEPGALLAVKVGFRSEDGKLVATLKSDWRGRKYELRIGGKLLARFQRRRAYGIFWVNRFASCEISILDYVAPDDPLRGTILVCGLTITMMNLR